MIVFESKFDKNVTKSLNVFTMKKLWWMYLIFSLLFAFLGVTSILEEDMVFGIFMICFGVCFTPLCVGLTFLLQKKINKSMPILSENTIETYTFYEDKFEIVQQKGEDFFSNTSCKYTSYINKIKETKDCYFIYISNVQAHVVYKDSLKEGSIEELNGILTANLGKKFKALKK